MGKKFVKTTFAILSFMMLLPTSVFAEDAGNMEAAFVGESGLEADQSASYSDADSTLPFEEEKNNHTSQIMCSYSSSSSSISETNSPAPTALE